MYTRDFADGVPAPSENAAQGDGGGQSFRPIVWISLTITENTKSKLKIDYFKPPKPKTRSQRLIN